MSNVTGFGSARATTPTLRTFVAEVEDKPGVLNRVSSMFRRRGFNIDSLTVSRTAHPGFSRMTLVVRADDDTAHRFVANLYKLVNVLKVDELGADSVVRDLALVKVVADSGARAQVLQLCEVFRARPIDVTPDSMIVEITGTQDKLDGFVELLRPFGIQEIVRTGAIAMTRGAREEEMDSWRRSTTTATQTSA